MTLEQSVNIDVEPIGNEARKILYRNVWKIPMGLKKGLKMIKSTVLQHSQGNKTIEATLVKDLFVLILCLSVQQRINIAEFLKSPFTSAPLCLIHIDGSVNL